MFVMARAGTRINRPYNLYREIVMTTESKTFREAEQQSKDVPWHPRSADRGSSNALTALVRVFCLGFVVGGVLMCLYTLLERTK